MEDGVYSLGFFNALHFHKSHVLNKYFGDLERNNISHLILEGCVDCLVSFIHSFIKPHVPEWFSCISE